MEIQPNPASEQCSVIFDLMKESSLKIGIYNSIGVEVVNPFNDELLKGKNIINFSLEGTPSGSYYLLISDGILTYIKIFKIIK